MIPRAGVANSALSHDDLADLAVGKVPVDILLISGSSYLEDPARTAVADTAANIARSGALVAFDIVPHNSYQRWSPHELLAAIEPCAVVIAEAVTLARLFGLELAGGDPADVAALVPSPREALDGRTLLLRYGAGEINQSLVVLLAGSTCHRATGYATTIEPAGFGDRLTAVELVEVFNDLRSRDGAA